MTSHFLVLTHRPALTSLTSSLCLRAMEELTQQKLSLGLRVEELEAKLCHLSSVLQTKEREAEVCLPRPLPCPVGGAQRGSAEGWVLVLMTLLLYFVVKLASC